MLMIQKERFGEGNKLKCTWFLHLPLALGTKVGELTEITMPVCASQFFVRTVFCEPQTFLLFIYSSLLDFEQLCRVCWCVFLREK